MSKLSLASKELILNQTALKKRYQEQQNDVRSLANDNGSDLSVNDGSSMNSEERDEQQF
jgi:hypothetical protein